MDTRLRHALGLRMNRPAAQPAEAPPVEDINVPRVDRTLDFLDLYYRLWHRVDLQGGDGIAPQGGAIFFGNHAGFNMLDILMTMVAVRKHTASRRLLRGMHHRAVANTPLVGKFIRHRLGGVIGSQANARYLLERGEAILTYPEGGNSSGKPFSARRRLVPMEQFGSGFVRLAQATGIALVPVATVGCEEAMPTLCTSTFFGRRFHFNNDRYPIVPQSALTLLPSALGLPLHSFHFLFGFPAKIRILIGEPMLVRHNDDVDAAKKHCYGKLEDMIAQLCHTP